MRSRATIAKPAIAAALIVNSVTEIARVADTQTPTLPAEPEPDRPPTARVETTGEAMTRAGLAPASRAHRWWCVPLVAIGLGALLIVSLAATVPSKWVAEQENARLGVQQPTEFARVPASVQPIDDLITIDDLGDEATQYPPSGDFLMVTVMAPEQSVLSWLVGRGDPAIEFLTAEDKFGLRTPQQNRTLDQASMRTSEQVAQYVALQRLGYDVELVLGEVLIQGMVCLEPDPDGIECARWSPSDAVLDPGDKILVVDGEDVETVEDLSALLAGRSPGDLVPMTIERPDQGRLDVMVELTVSPEDPDRTIVGFYPFDTARVELPFDMSIDPKGVGGPSAGLAFTLTIIDELTEGELTGDTRVAVTGTIGLDGRIGPIGGLRQKASAVAQSGVEVFLVPAAQGPDDIAAARAAAGDDVEIVPVATLDEALDVLAERGGDPVPPPAAGSSGG